MSTLRELLEEEKRIKILLEEEKEKINGLLEKKQNEVKLRLNEYEKELIQKINLEIKNEEKKLRNFFEIRLEKLKFINNSLKILDEELFFSIVNNHYRSIF